MQAPEDTDRNDIPMSGTIFSSRQEEEEIEQVTVFNYSGSSVNTVIHNYPEPQGLSEFQKKLERQWEQVWANHTHKSIRGDLQSKGFSWEEDNCWDITSIWDTCLLSVLLPLKNEPAGEGAIYMGLQDMETIAKSALKRFGVTPYTPVDLRNTNFIVVRIEDFRRTEVFCQKSRTVHFPVSEFVIEEDGKNSYQRCTPSVLFAGGLLAEVLYEIVCEQDIILAMGTVKRCHTVNEGLRIHLLNFETKEADLSVMRFSFVPHRIHNPVRMLERITPCSPRHGRNLMKCEYALFYGDRNTCGVSKQFEWKPNYERYEPEFAILGDAVTIPIRFHHDVRQAYHRIIACHPQKPLLRPKFPSTVENRSFIEYEHHSPVFLSGHRIRSQDSILQILWRCLSLLSLILFIVSLLMWLRFEAAPEIRVVKPCTTCLLRASDFESSTSLAVIWEEKVSSFILGIVDSIRWLFSWIYEHMGVRSFSERFLSGVNSTTTTKPWNGPIV